MGSYNGIFDDTNPAELGMISGSAAAVAHQVAYDNCSAATIENRIQLALTLQKSVTGRDLSESEAELWRDIFKIVYSYFNTKYNM